MLLVMIRWLLNGLSNNEALDLRTCQTVAHGSYFKWFIHWYTRQSPAPADIENFTFRAALFSWSPCAVTVLSDFHIPVFDRFRSCPIYIARGRSFSLCFSLTDLLLRPISDERHDTPGTCDVRVGSCLPFHKQGLNGSEKMRSAVSVLFLSGPVSWQFKSDAITVKRLYVCL
jgi:hypothetical protein